MQGTGKYDSLLKTAGIVALALVVMSVLNSLLAGGGTGMEYGPQYGYQNGLDLNGLISFILALALKVLWLVLLVSLVMGSVVFIKKYMVENNINLNLNGFQIVTRPGYSCSSCGANLREEFRFCPECGESVSPISKERGKEE